MATTDNAIFVSDDEAPTVEVARVADPAKLRPGTPAVADPYQRVVEEGAFVPTAAQLTIPKQLFHDPKYRALLGFHGIGTGKTQVGVRSVMEWFGGTRSRPLPSRSPGTISESTPRICATQPTRS